MYVTYYEIVVIIVSNEMLLSLSKQCLLLNLVKFRSNLTLPHSEKRTRRELEQWKAEFEEKMEEMTKKVRRLSLVVH